MYIYDSISPNSSWVSNVSEKNYRKIQNTHFISNNLLPKIVPGMR